MTRRVTARNGSINMNRASKGQNWRKNLIRKVKTIQHRQLGMSDEQYRTMLEDRYGKASATKLSLGELQDLSIHLEELTGKSVEKKPEPRRDPQAEMIRALWKDMYEARIVRDPSEQALNRFVHRQTGVSSMAWLGTRQASKVIEALKDWKKREEAAMTASNGR